MKTALEVTPQMKCKRLQRLKIQKNQSIKNFNWRYNKLYTSLPSLYCFFITIDDYAESISYRPFSRAQVVTQQCTDLEEAYEEAELAETSNKGNSSEDTVMATIYRRSSTGFINYQRSSQHPFKFFGSNNANQSYSHSNTTTTRQTAKGKG
ncbi:MAG: hypothetical protein E7Z84_09175 [Methanosphaera stadtmanae]|nr:hypothetical protein [Methanosphaera stadtmanae]